MFLLFDLFSLLSKAGKATGLQLNPGSLKLACEAVYMLTHPTDIEEYR